MIIDYRVVDQEAAVRVPIGQCRFFGDVREVHSEADVKAFVEDMKKKYPDANHHCWAYRIGIGNQQVFRYSDDGEPSQSAGAPILTAIDHLQLTNTMVVVSRIYGGVNQGVGGLIRAYHLTAITVLKEAGWKTVVIKKPILVPCRYEQLGMVLRELEAISADILGMEYLEDVTVSANVQPVDFEKFAARLFDLSLGTIEISWAKEEN